MLYLSISSIVPCLQFTVFAFGSRSHQPFPLRYEVDRSAVCPTKLQCFGKLADSDSPFLHFPSSFEIIVWIWKGQYFVHMCICMCVFAHWCVCLWHGCAQQPLPGEKDDTVGGNQNQLQVVRIGFGGWEGGLHRLQWREGAEMEVRKSSEMEGAGDDVDGRAEEWAPRGACENQRAPPPRRPAELNYQENTVAKGSRKDTASICHTLTAGRRAVAAGCGWRVWGCGGDWGRSGRQETK